MMPPWLDEMAKWVKPKASPVAPKVTPKADISPEISTEGMITHTVVPGDPLWHLAQLYDVKGGWPAIFAANIDIIERYSREHGSSADGHWIYPSQVIRIPGPQKV